MKGQTLFGEIKLHDVPKDMESVDALIHKKDDRVCKEFEKWANSDIFGQSRRD